MEGVLPSFFFLWSLLLQCNAGFPDRQHSLLSCISNSGRQPLEQQPLEQQPFPSDLRAQQPVKVLQAIFHGNYRVWGSRTSAIDQISSISSLYVPLSQLEVFRVLLFSYLVFLIA